MSWPDKIMYWIIWGGKYPGAPGKDWPVVPQVRVSPSFPEYNRANGVSESEPQEGDRTARDCMDDYSDFDYHG